MRSFQTWLRGAEPAAGRDALRLRGQARRACCVCRRPLLLGLEIYLGSARRVLAMFAARAALTRWFSDMMQRTSGLLPSTLPWPRNFLGLGVNSFLSFLFRLSMAQRAACEYAGYSAFTRAALGAKTTSYHYLGC